MLLADAVVGPHQPRLKIREDSVDAWEVLGRVLSVSLCLAPVVVAPVCERTVAAPAVGMHDAARRHGLFEKTDQRRSGQILDDA